MSERTVAQEMSDHEFVSAIDSKVAREMTSSALTFATNEALRARIEARQQAATIKALADALEMLEHRAAANYDIPTGYHEIIINTEERERVRTALRLAGRLP